MSVLSFCVPTCYVCGKDTLFLTQSNESTRFIQGKILPNKLNLEMSHRQHFIFFNILPPVTARDGQLGIWHHDP